MAKRDYYEVLGIDKNATDDDIKKAYKKMAIKYHPDRNPGDKEAEEKFKEAAEAYSVLSDKDKRARYDQFGPDAVDGMGGAGGGFGGGGFSMDDIFSMFGDLFGGRGGGFSGFGGFGGGGSSRQSERVFRGNDLRVKVKLNLQEIAEGAEKKLKVKKYVTCPDCQGSGAEKGSGTETCSECNGSGYVLRTRQSMFGMMQTQSACPRCGGEGRIIKNKCRRCSGEGIIYGEEIITAKIPAGATSEYQLTMSGKGNAGKHNGVPGDLYIQIVEEESKELIRDGNDLVYNLMISVPQAALGAQVDIPTVNGKVRMTIDAGTQPGKVMRLRGKGLPAINGYGTGDLLVRISVYIPETLSRDEKNAMEQLKDSDNFRPSESTRQSFFQRFKNLFD